MTKKIRISLIALCLAVLGVCISLFFVSAAQPVEVETHLEESYALGTELSVPEGDVNVGGQTVKILPDIISPSKQAYRTRSLTLSETGRYTLIYKGEVSGESFEYRSYFNVFEPLGASGSKSDDVYFGRVEGAEDAGQGLVVELSEGSTFHYNSIINLKGKKITDPLIDLNVVPSSSGTADFIALHVVLTDAHDPENTVHIRIRQTPDEAGRENVAYVMAGYGSESLYGWSWGKYSASPLNGLYGSDMNYGFTARSSFTGYDYTDETCGMGIGINERTGDIAYLYPLYESDNVVINLKTDTCFASPWEGFTTGEVYLSIYATDYTQGKARFVIKSIYDEDLSAQFAEVRTPSQISVDSEGYDLNNMPGALVDKPYPVFSAEVKGADIPLSVKAFYGVSPSSRVEYRIEDGAVTPDRPGYYHIEYKYVSDFGQEVVKRIFFKAYSENGLQPLTITADDSPMTATAGEILALNRTPVTSGDEKLGNISIETYARHIASGEVISFAGGEFTPARTGEYEIVFRASVFAGLTAECKFTLTVQPPETLVPDLEDSDINEFYLTGEEYAMPEVYAVIYDEDGESREKCEVKAIINGQTTEGDTFVAEQPGYIRFELNAGGKSYTTSDIMIIDSGIGTDSLKPQNFFYTREGEFTSRVVSAGSYRNLEFTTESGGLLSFVNPVKSKDLFFKFNIGELTEGAGADADSVNIYFTDSKDSSRSVKISIVQQDGVAKYRINDGAVMSLVINGNSRPFTGVDSASAYTLQLTSAGVVICGSNSREFGSYYNRQTNSAGGTFEGFPSGKVMLDVEVEISAAKSGTSVHMVQLNTHVLYVTRDRVAPEYVNYGEDVGGGYAEGSVVRFGEVFAMDVFSPNTEITVTVTDEAGNVINNTDGIAVNKLDATLPFEVEFNGIGQYTVRYDYADGFGNDDYKVFYIDIYDSVPPEISFEVARINVEAGKEITLPTVKISDNHAENMQPEIYVERPDGVLTKLTSDKYTFESTGIYRIHGIVSDGKYTDIATCIVEVS